MYMIYGVGDCMCACVWRPEVDVSCFPQLLSTLVVWGRVSNQTWSSHTLSHLSSPGNPPARYLVFSYLWWRPQVFSWCCRPVTSELSSTKRTIATTYNVISLRTRENWSLYFLILVIQSSVPTKLTVIVEVRAWENVICGIRKFWSSPCWYYMIFVLLIIVAHFVKSYLAIHLQFKQFSLCILSLTFGLEFIHLNTYLLSLWR